MLPHAGADSALFRSVVQLGQTLRALAPVAGSRRKPASVAILFDWTSWWASQQDSHPTDRLRYRQEALDWYVALQRAGLRVDVIPSCAPLEGYRLIVAPVLHVTPPELTARLSSYVDGGGHFAATYFSGIVDDNDHIIPGGYPGGLRELLGIRVEEMAPLLDDESVSLDNGTTATMWTDRMEVADPDVKVLARYASGEQAGRPAITHRPFGRGSASYVSTRLGPAGLAPVIDELAGFAGLHSDLPPNARGRVELAVRHNDTDEFWFLINLTGEPVQVEGIDGEVLAGEVALAPRGVAVLRRPVPKLQNGVTA
jgi:beta-galactosidase